MINNRQNGRRRGRGGNNGGGNGGGNPRQGGGQGRPDNGNRIDSRARGNASQLYEKYKNLARDAQMSGDRVNIEYYLQYADHYFRVLADTRSRFEDNSQPRRQQPFDLDGDDDYGDEGEPIRAGEQAGDEGRDGNRETRDGRDANGHGNRDATARDDRPQQQGNYRRERGETGNRDFGNRDSGSRDGGNRDTGNREAGNRADGNQRSESEPRNGRGNWEPRDRDARPQQREEEVGGQHRSDPPQRHESLGERAEAVLEADAPAPRKRGRPRREQPAEAAAPAFDSDRLPPSLTIAAANDADGDEPKPRRRGRPPRAAAADVPSAAE